MNAMEAADDVNDVHPQRPARAPDTLVTAQTDQRQDGELSPNTEELFNEFGQSLRAKEAKLRKDPSGKIRVIYPEEERNPLAHVDTSMAHMIQVGKDADDVRARTEVFLEMIDAIKQKRAPSGVVLDKTKVKVSPQGRYEEGKEFERTMKVLGKGIYAGDIVVVKDKGHGSEHAVKTVMLSTFREDGIRCWVDLNDSDTFPSLYMFTLKDNKVEMHMEILENAVTLDEWINDHLSRLQKKAPELVRPFSLCIFHGLLGAITEMMDKNWTHQDLHGKNVLITKDSVNLKVLDFDKACPLKTDSGFNFMGLKTDILQAIRHFCGVYIDNTLLDKDDANLEREIRNETRNNDDATPERTLSQTLSEMPWVEEQQRKEVVLLVKMTYREIADPNQENFNPSFGSVMQHLEKALEPETMSGVKVKVGACLFPDVNTDVNMKQGATEAEAEEGARAEDTPRLEAAETLDMDMNGFNVKPKTRATSP